MTDRDKQIISYRQSGRTLLSIGNEFGITKEGVRRICRFHGISKPKFPHSPYKGEIGMQIVELHESGLTYKQIKEKLNLPITIPSIHRFYYSMCKFLGKVPKKVHHTYERNDERNEKIRTEYTQRQITQTQLAKEYNLCRVTINRIINKRRGM